MLGLRSTIAAAAIGLIATLSYAYMWKSAKERVTYLESELLQAQVNAKTLKRATEDQQKTITELKSLIQQNQEKVDELSSAKHAAELENARIQAEINRLRSTEASLALQAPFARGNYARVRFNDSMQRIAGETSGDSAGGDNTNTTSGSNSSGTD